MASQKIENLLNLALDASPEERARSSELEVGFNPIDKEWDLIVKCKAHAVYVEQKGLFVLGHIFKIELVAEVNHLLRRKSAQEHRIGRHIQEILLEIVYYIDALVCGA